MIFVIKNAKLRRFLRVALPFVLIPAVVAWLVSELMRRRGLIKDGDYKLDL